MILLQLFPEKLEDNSATGHNGQICKDTILSTIASVEERQTSKADGAFVRKRRSQSSQLSAYQKGEGHFGTPVPHLTSEDANSVEVWELMTPHFLRSASATVVPLSEKAVQQAMHEGAEQLAGGEDDVLHSESDVDEMVEDMAREVDADDEDNWEYECTEEEIDRSKKDSCLIAKLFVADGIGKFGMPSLDE
ncbi:hypothetical protein MMC29_000034 [Sticta canariensis]|nr:hypothetical protein [Sticta canariensis]